MGGPDEPRRAGDDLVGDQAVADDPRRAIDIGQEELERPHPLGDPVGDLRPLRCRKDPGHHVERERTFFAIEIEGDPLIHEGPGQARGSSRHVVGTHLGQRGGHAAVGLAVPTCPVHHFVEGDLGQARRLRSVPLEQVSHGPQGARHVFRRDFTAANNR